MDGVADNQGDFGRDFLLNAKNHPSLSRFVIRLYQEGIRLTLKEDIGMPLEITDVGFGPFNL